MSFAPKKLVFVVALSLLLCACGFHLRGIKFIPECFKVIAVDAGAPCAPYDPVLLELRRELRDSGFVVDQLATTRLVLTQQKLEQQIANISNTGQAARYKFTYVLNFYVKNCNEIILPEQKITVTYELEADVNKMLGQDNREITMLRDLHAAAIAQVIDRLVNAG